MKAVTLLLTILCVQAFAADMRGTIPSASSFTLTLPPQNSRNEAGYSLPHYKVGAKTVFSYGVTTRSVCKAAMQRIGESDFLAKILNGRAAVPIKVQLRSITYEATPPGYHAADPVLLTALKDWVLNMARADEGKFSLHYSSPIYKAFTREELATLDDAKSKGPLLSDPSTMPFQTPYAFEFAATDGQSEVTVILSRERAQQTPKPDLLEMQNNQWKLTTETPRLINQDLVNAKVTDVGAKFLSHNEFLLLPGPVRQNLLSFDLLYESIGQPLSVDGYNAYINTSDGLYRWRGAKVFRLSEEDGSILGYIMQTFFTAHRSASLYMAGREDHQLVYVYTTRYYPDGARADFQSEKEAVYQSSKVFDVFGRESFDGEAKRIGDAKSGRGDIY